MQTLIIALTVVFCCLGAVVGTWTIVEANKLGRDRLKKRDNP